MTAGRDSSVHVFSLKGIDFAYDGSSGSLHVLDVLGKAVLLWAIDNPRSICAGDVPSGLVDGLRGRFSESEITSAWQELRSSAGKTLFCRDEALDTCGESPDVTQALDAGLKSMCIDVAHDCNLACDYCFASKGDFGGVPSLMTPETGKAAIDFLIGASGTRRYLDVDFFGGEPLLAFDTVSRILDYAREEGPRRGKEFRFTLTTNCTLLDAGKARFLDDRGVNLILSLDGRPETHDRMRTFKSGLPTHAVALKNAKTAVKSRSARGYCIVRGTYTKHNLDFDQDVKYLYENGFRQISLENAVGEDASWALGESDLGEIRKAYSNLVDLWVESAARGDPFEFYHFELGLDRGLCRERRVTGCGAGYEYIAVTPEGHIYPCHQLVGQPGYLLGDIYRGILRRDLAETFCRARVPFKPVCASCWARYLCGGGCHARATASTGDLLKPDPFSCQIMKTRLEHALLAQYLVRKMGAK